MRSLLLLAVTASLLGGAVSAQPLPAGTVLLSTHRTTQPFPPSSGTNRIEAWNEDGSFREDLVIVHDQVNIFHDVAVDRSGRIFYTSFQEVTRLEGDRQRTLVIPEGPGRIAFDRDGDVFLNGETLRHFSPTGQSIASYAAFRRFYPFDIAADQCTALGAVSGQPAGTDQIARFDICRGVRLQPFVQETPGIPSGIRILPSGEVLHTEGSGLVIRSSSGEVRRRYALPFFPGLIALAPDAASVWVTTGFGGVRRIDLSTGAVVTSFDTLHGIWGLAVVGEPRAAFSTAPIPTASPMALLLIAATLAVVGAAAVARAS